MDAVYILGNGSLSNNLELRYSVRSLFQNMLDLRNVYIVGSSVDFLPSAVHIPATDKHERVWRNALEKTRLACDTPAISDEFLLMNDDFFMLEPFQGADFPFYALKGSSGGCNGREWFGVHCPIRIKKDWYSNLPLTVDMAGDFSPRSFYCNFYNAPPTFTTDFILRHGTDMPEFDTQIIGRDWFSISNSTILDPVFRVWIDSLFPRPSRFEI